MMKKVILILAALGSMSFICPDNSTRVTWNCGSTCLTVKVDLTANLEIDAGIFDSGIRYRKPTLAEAVAYGNYQNDFCE